jgi:hypothetical protein
MAGASVLYVNPVEYIECNDTTIATYCDTQRTQGVSSFNIQLDDNV